MISGVFSAIGIYFLYFISGALFGNAQLHLNWGFSFEKLPEKYKNSLMGSHFGNAVLGVVYLLIGIFIPALLGYHFGLNLNTLLIMTGFGLVAITLSMRFDKSDKK